MYYMIGDITMESKMPSVGGFLKAALSSESIFRPTYTGTGELYLEPTAGGIHSMHLDNETWILENGAYYGSEMGVEVDVHRESANRFQEWRGLSGYADQDQWNRYGTRQDTRPGRGIGAREQQTGRRWQVRVREIFDPEL